MSLGAKGRSCGMTAVGALAAVIAAVYAGVLLRSVGQAWQLLPATAALGLLCWLLFRRRTGRWEENYADYLAYVEPRIRNNPPEQAEYLLSVFRRA